MVEVDRKTVLELLRAAILSEDHGVWKAGLGAAVEMRSADVAELLDAIRDKLSAEKQSALKALLPRAAR